MTDYFVSDAEYAAARSAYTKRNVKTPNYVLGHFERHTGLLSATVLGPGDFKHHPLGFLIAIWNVVLIAWALTRVVNGDATSLYIGQVFAALINVVLGAGALVWLHYNLAHFYSHIEGLRGVSLVPDLYRRIQDNFLANMNSLYVGYASTFVGIIMTMLSILVYVRADFVDQNGDATVYPLTAPITALQIVVLGADYLTIATSMAIVFVTLSAISSGITRSFDYRTATRSPPRESGPNSLFAAAATTSAAATTDSSSKSLGMAATLSSRIPLLGVSATTQ